MGRLDGRAALITGASSGIGEATARAFVREGAEVALLARRREQLESLAASLGDGAVATVADVRDPAAIAAAVKETVDRFGRLDVVVNSAGVVHPLSLADLDADAWRETIDTNLSGSFYVAREAGLHMSENGGGSIVNVGSDLSILGMPMYVAVLRVQGGGDRPDQGSGCRAGAEGASQCRLSRPGGHTNARCRVQVLPRSRCSPRCDARAAPAQAVCDGRRGCRRRSVLGGRCVVRNWRRRSSSTAARHSSDQVPLPERRLNATRGEGRRRYRRWLRAGS